MSYEDYKRPDVKPIWCAGCGLYGIFNAMINIFDERGLKPIILSGIGCTGRATGYFNLDGVNGLHGRIIPFAEGVKRAREDKEVIVISGDGDILGIGGNHLLHSSRRDVDMLVICMNNNVYALTGGQVSPTTKRGMKTITTPDGNDTDPIDAQRVIMSNKKYFYARTTPFHAEHMKDVIKQAIDWKGFAFVEIITLCLPTVAKKMGLDNPAKVFNWLKENYKIVENKNVLGEFELGVVKSE